MFLAYFKRLIRLLISYTPHPSTSLHTPDYRKPRTAIAFIKHNQALGLQDNEHLRKLLRTA